MGKEVLDVFKPVTSLLMGDEEEFNLPSAQQMPTPDSKIARRKGEKKAQKKYGKTGRVGTMLTAEESKLG